MQRMPKSRTGLIGVAVALVLGLAIAGVAWRSPSLQTENPDAAPDEDGSGSAVEGVPSGQQITYQEAILEPQPAGDAWLRLRFVAPRIGDGAGNVSFAEAADDMAFLCREVGVEVARQAAPEVTRIIVSLSAEETEFARSYPDIVQYFEQYRITAENTCVWEDF